MFDVRLRFTSCMPFTGPPGDSGRELPSETIGNRLSPVHRFATLHHTSSPFGLCKIAPAHCMRWLFDVATTPHHEDSSSLIILHASSNIRDFCHNTVLTIHLHSLVTYSQFLTNVYLHNTPLLIHRSHSIPSTNRLWPGLLHFYTFTPHFCAVYTSISVQSPSSTI